MMPSKTRQALLKCLEQGYHVNPQRDRDTPDFGA